MWEFENVSSVDMYGRLNLLNELESMFYKSKPMPQRHTNIACCGRI